MRILPCADAGLLVEVGDLDDVLALYAALSDDPPAGVVELVPAARTLLLRFAPPEAAGVGTGAGAATGGRGGARSTAVADAVREAWETVHGSRDRRRPATPRERVEIPVVYDGPDLDDVGELTGLGVSGVIAAHTGRDWTVAFCGFVPGFGYLVDGDPRLRVPRRATSRTRVARGSVGLAGEYSGVYPRESPGGWQLIGHTDLSTFDLEQEPPALLRPGVRVRFVPVSGGDSGPGHGLPPGR
jgi:KipI family sensor histidine kinase inhibitor